MCLKPWQFSILGLALSGLVSSTVYADEFTKADLDRWQQEYMAVVKQGQDKKMFKS